MHNVAHGAVREYDHNRAIFARILVWAESIVARLQVHDDETVPREKDV